MSNLVLPEWVARNQRQRRIIEDQSSGVAQTRYWNPLLREIDPRLQLVFIGNVEGEIVGVVPWRWHICRVNETGPDSYWPLTTKDGGVREMGSVDLEDFKGRDLWNPTIRHELATMRRRRQEAKTRAEALRSEQRVHEIASNLNALNRPSAVFNTDMPWTNRPAGKRGKKS